MLALIYTGRSIKNLDDQDLLGIENRDICRAIGLRFVGWWATFFLKPFEDGHLCC